MTQAQVTRSHVHRPGSSPVEAATPLSAPAVNAERTTAATRIDQGAQWWLVHGWGIAPLQYWLRRRG